MHRKCQYSHKTRLSFFELSQNELPPLVKTEGVIRRKLKEHRPETAACYPFFKRIKDYSVRIFMISALSVVLRICTLLSADLNSRLTSARNCKCGPVLFTGESVIIKIRQGS